jgi:hypothetical protein
MPTTPFPDNDTAALYDALIIDGTLYNVGLVDFDGDGIKRKVKVRGVPGANGSSVRDRGSDTVDFTMTVSVWEREHFGALDALMELLNPQTQQPARATRVHLIQHPILALDGIAQAYFKSAKILRRQAGRIFTKEFTWIQWLPAQAGRGSVTRRPTVVPPAGNTFSRPGAEQVRPNGTTLVAIPPPSASATGPRR